MAARRGLDVARGRPPLDHSEATAYVRLRRMIVVDTPTNVGDDEAAFARRLHGDRPIGPSLAVLQGVRTASLQLLESLTPDARAPRLMRAAMG